METNADHWALLDTRLDMIAGFDQHRTEAELRASTAQALHEFVAGMNLDNVLVRRHRRAVERFTDAAAWAVPLGEEDNAAARFLAGLPSAKKEDDAEDAKRFDLLVLRRQLAQLEGDARTAERTREKIQGLAESLVRLMSVPSVAGHRELVEAVAGDEWWLDVTLPMLELARLRLRGVIGLIDPDTRAPVYADFDDELLESTEVTLPGVPPGINMARFRAKALACVERHADHVALQRLRRNKQLTPDDLTSLEEMLLSCGVGQRAELSTVAEQTGGLGLFIRSLVGLDRAAAQEVFAEYLDRDRFDAAQINFVTMMIEELTQNGVMDPGRLFESPYTDHKRVDIAFPHDVTHLVGKLRQIKDTALPVDVA